MNDFFKIKAICPECGVTSEMVFETDTIGQRGNEFELGANVMQNNLAMWDCDIEKAISQCPKCSHHLYGIIRIFHFKYENVHDIKAVKTAY